jgi:hypothetical protein
MSLDINGNVQVADTGYYQLTFGIYSGDGTTIPFEAQLNGVPDTTRSIVTRILGTMANMSVIVQITVNPTTIALVNEGGATFTFLTTSTRTPVAFMTVIKLAP